jgi:hypothetical protein
MSSPRTSTANGGTAANPEMRIRMVTLTPTWAEELLKKNHPRNRKVQWALVARYARDQENDNWEETPEPICIDVDDYMTNGQNRCHAVLRSGKSIRVALATNCPRKAIQGQDQGKPRSAVDVARISGRHLVGGGNDVVAAIRQMARGTKLYIMTNHEILAFHDQHAAALRFSYEVLPNKTKGITKGAVRAVIARAWYRKADRDRIRLFAKILTDGVPENVTEDSAALQLRNWLIRTFLGGLRGRKGMRVSASGIASGNLVYAKTQAALVKFLAKEPTQTLTETRKEHFPLPQEWVTEDHMKALNENRKADRQRQRTKPTPAKAAR